MAEHTELPANIQSYICKFDDSLSDSEYSSQKYAYRILFVPKTANRKGQADRVIEFVKSDSPFAEKANIEYELIKETEKPKFLASQIIDIIREKGFSKFSIYNHTQLWKSMDAKNPSKGYGKMVAGKYWYWYENWIDDVYLYCKKNGQKFR